jgi:hypothetical protein
LLNMVGNEPDQLTFVSAKTSRECAMTLQVDDKGLVYLNGLYVVNRVLGLNLTKFTADRFIL